MRRTLILLSSLLLGLTGCAGSPDAGPAAGSLVGTTWTLTRLGSESITEDLEITLTFAGDGRVSGFGGCNRYFGDYRQSGAGRLGLGPLASTKKFCLGPGSALERRYLDALHAVTRFDLSDGQLRLSHPGGELLFAPRS